MNTDWQDFEDKDKWSHAPPVTRRTVELADAIINPQEQCDQAQVSQLKQEKEILVQMVEKQDYLFALLKEKYQESQLKVATNLMNQTILHMGNQRKQLVHAIKQMQQTGILDSLDWTYNRDYGRKSPLTSCGCVIRCIRNRLSDTNKLCSSIRRYDRDSELAHGIDRDRRYAVQKLEGLKALLECNRLIWDKAYLRDLDEYRKSVCLQILGAAELVIASCQQTVAYWQEKEPTNNEIAKMRCREWLCECFPVFTVIFLMVYFATGQEFP